MTDEILGNSNLPFEEILVKVRELDTSRTPNLKDRKELVIRQTKTSYKVAVHWTILNEHTGKVRHRSLSIKTIYHRKKAWIEKK